MTRGNLRIKEGTDSAFGNMKTKRLRKGTNLNIRMLIYRKMRQIVSWESTTVNHQKRFLSNMIF